MTVGRTPHEQPLSVVALFLACLSLEVSLETAQRVDSIGLVYTVDSAVVFTLVVIAAVRCWAWLVSQSGAKSVTTSKVAPTIASSTVARIIMPLLALALAFPGVYAVGWPRQGFAWIMVTPFYAAIVSGIAYAYLLVRAPKAPEIRWAKAVWIRSSLVVAFVAALVGVVVGILITPILIVPSALSALGVWNVARRGPLEYRSTTLP